MAIRPLVTRSIVLKHTGGVSWNQSTFKGSSMFLTLLLKDISLRMSRTHSHGQQIIDAPLLLSVSSEIVY